MSIGVFQVAGSPLVGYVVSAQLPDGGVVGVGLITGGVLGVVPELLGDGVPVVGRGVPAVGGAPDVVGGASLREICAWLSDFAPPEPLPHAASVATASESDS